MRMKKTPLIQLAVDAALFLSAAIPLLLVHILVEPFKFGFFCDDRSIQYPYRQDTVPMPMCAAVGVAITLGSFIVVEFTLSLGCRQTQDTRLFHVLWTIAKLAVIFSFGMGANLILTETAKLAVGGLRPNFLAVCKPNMTLVNCSMGYIEHFQCTNNVVSKKELMDSRKSFPSGHCSFATFTAFFVGYYYQKRLKTEYSVFLKTFLQVAVAILATFTACSRVTDFRHHWGDVLAGSALGIAVAAWTIVCMGKNLNLEMRPFLRKRTTSPTLDTQLPMSDPCTPEPAAFLSPPLRFDKNEA